MSGIFLILSKFDIKIDDWELLVLIIVIIGEKGFGGKIR